MLKNKNKKPVEVSVEEIEGEVPSDEQEPVEDASPYFNQEEEEVLNESSEVKDKGRVSIQRMEQVVALVEGRFNLKGNDSQRPFTVTAFSDKGSKCTIQLANEDYSLSVSINDMECMLGSIEE